MRDSTRTALARYSGRSWNMSLTRLCVTMSTLLGSVVAATSLMKRYTMRRRLPSVDWKSFVTPKKTSSASAPLKLSPCVRK